MEQYIVPDILTVKSEELQEISRAILNIIQTAEDTLFLMRRLTELEICSHVLMLEEEKLFEEVQSINQASEALYEIAAVSIQTEREAVDEIIEGKIRKPIYKKTTELNRIEPGKIDIF